MEGEQATTTTPPPPPKRPSAALPDPIEAGGLQWALVSVVTPEEARAPGTDRGDLFAFKIRGAFATIEEANEHARRLIALDPTFSIYVMKMYNWCPYPPPPGSVPLHYQEEELDKLINGTLENRRMAGDAVRQRAREASAGEGEAAIRVGVVSEGGGGA